MVDIKLDTENDLEWVEKTIPIFREKTSDNLIVNGGFDTDSGWENDPMGADPSYIEDGHAIVGGEFWQEAELEEGVKYEVSFTVSDLPIGEIAVFYVEYIAGVDIFHSYNATNGVNTTSFVSPYSGLVYILFYRAVFGVIYQLDNVSMYEVVDIETKSDIDYDYSDFVNVVDLLEAKKGEIRQFPMAGADIKSFQMSRYDQQKMDSIIKETLILDKWKPNSVIVNAKDRENLEVTINPKRND